MEKKKVTSCAVIEEELNPSGRDMVLKYGKSTTFVRLDDVCIQIDLRSRRDDTAKG